MANLAHKGLSRVCQIGDWDSLEHKECYEYSCMCDCHSGEGWLLFSARVVASKLTKNPEFEVIHTVGRLAKKRKQEKMQKEADENREQFI